jgi:hypothetical protein
MDRRRRRRQPLRQRVERRRRPERQLARNHLEGDDAE